MSSYSAQYPGLAHLFDCYLYQYWPDEYDGDVWIAVDEFTRSEPVHAALLGSNVETLLKDKQSEAELEAVVAELDGNYRPEIHGETYRGWLTAVAERVDKILKEQAGS